MPKAQQFSTIRLNTIVIHFKMKTFKYSRRQTPLEESIAKEGGLLIAGGILTIVAAILGLLVGTVYKFLVCS
jgi:hypothetical protein